MKFAPVSCSEGYHGVMSRRNYSQFCGLAHALDVVGERWTLLIVRELGSGPKRYTQLADTLAGIGTSLLATRMRQLESDGIVQRRLALDQPSSTVLYELTSAGRELAEAVIPLAVWGARHQMDDADVDREAFRAEWALGFLVAGSDAVSSDADGVYEFHVDDSVACLHVRNGRMSVRTGPSATPADVVVRTTRTVVAEIAGQRTTITDAIAEGQIDAEGDPTAVARLASIVDGRIFSRLHA
jgi:DNA-binding HxlR family transcriptional regulator